MRAFLNSVFRSSQLPWWLFTIIITLALTLPVLLKDGMFMDAMLYTSVAHNLADGLGTFWFPQFGAHNVAGLSAFHEQPPLVFGIQSVFFRVFGDSRFVERGYTFLTMVGTILLLVWFWRLLLKPYPKLLPFSWLPVLLWITIPVCFWSYSNNMNENTMGLFTLAATALLVISMTNAPSLRTQILLTGAGAVCVFLATLSKGLPGLFPLAIPTLCLLCFPGIGFSKMMAHTIGMMLVIGLIYGVLMLFPAPAESLTQYFVKRALQRIREVPTVNSRWFILGELFRQLIPQMLLTLLLYLISRRKQIAFFHSPTTRMALFCMGCGLAASAPLMLTLVQKGFYFVPSLPFFGLGFALLTVSIISELMPTLLTTERSYRATVGSGIFLLILVLGFSVGGAGVPGRDKDMLNDIHLIGPQLPARSIALVTAESWDNWSLQCYFMRYYKVSLEPNGVYPYCILPKAMAEGSVNGFHKFPLNTRVYDLWIKNE